MDDLKTKLPFLNKKKKGDEDLDEDEETGTITEVTSEDDESTSVEELDEELDSEEEEVTDNSLVGKLKTKLNSLSGQKKKSADSGKEKKKPNLIVIIGGLALIGFLFFTEVGDDESAPTQDPASLLKPREKKKPVAKAPEETPAEKPAETSAEKPAETSAEKPAETPVETATTTPSDTGVPTETVITPTETTPSDIAVTAEPTTPTDSPVGETNVDQISDVITPTDDVDFSFPTTETTVAPDTESLPTTTDIITDEDPVASDSDLTEQILKDLEGQSAQTPTQNKNVYVAPPNYENVGRGLIYNCIGKHWACVDGPSYKKCEDNSSFNKFNEKKSECYPFNVYETQSGCEKMQNRMVSSSAKTTFCSE